MSCFKRFNLSTNKSAHSLYLLKIRPEIKKLKRVFSQNWRKLFKTLKGSNRDWNFLIQQNIRPIPVIFVWYLIVTNK